MSINTKPALLIALLLAASTAWSFQPLVTDDTGTQGQGENQLEFSFSQERAGQVGVVNTTRLLPLTYTRGLSETLDLSVGVNPIRLSSNAPGTEVSSGSGNPSLGLKWRFYDNEASKSSLALKLDLGLPVDAQKEARGLGSARTSYAVTAILMQETSFGAMLANLATGYTPYHDTAANPDSHTVRASLAPIWQITDQWKLALDLGNETEWAAGSRNSTEFLELAAIYSPIKDLDCALGLTRSIDHRTPGTGSNAIAFGITWRFR